MSEKPSLTAAYNLETPEDSIALYRDWAASYDAGFVAENGYVLHAQVARAFIAAGGQGPVLDVGAGTGLCGVVLTAGDVGPVDGLDISAEMLRKAADKDVYRELITADLLAGLSVDAGTYQGLVSSGTFTHGHVGPEALAELLRIMAPGALGVLSINAAHFVARGFDRAFEHLSDAIGELSFEDVHIYDTNKGNPHAGDMARLAIFTKA